MDIDDLFYKVEALCEEYFRDRKSTRLNSSHT